MTALPETLERAFTPPDQEGEDKVVPLADAVAHHLKAGDTILLDRRSGAAMREMLRCFRGQHPRFTLVSASIANDAVSLIHAGLVKRLVCGVCMHRFPSTGPIRIVQERLRAGQLEMENWSLVSLNKRLEAAALGLPFLPTRSIRGSTAERENADAVRLVEDPFGEAGEVLVVKPLAPDIAFVHALAADRYGNAILPAPLEETLWGPRAARRVVVTTERLVGTDVIRHHNGLVNLPGALVSAVSVVPFGSHPEGMPPCPAAGLDGYKEDYRFLAAFRDAAEGQDTLEPWLQTWVYGSPDHDAYLERLGRVRIQALVDQVRPDTWWATLAATDWGAVQRRPWSDNEMMIVAAARHIKRRVHQGGFRALLVGIGPIFLAGGLAYHQLRQEGYGLDLLIGSGEVGYEPPPGDPNILSAGLVSSCKLVPDGSDVYAFLVAGTNNACLSVVGAMQVDARGNINSTRIGDRFMSGVGGVNDAGNAREVMVMARHARRTLIEELSYVTVPGRSVRTLVTNRAIFEKRGPDGTFILTGLLPRQDSTEPETAVEQAAAECSWPFQVADTLELIDPPTPDELLHLRALDVNGIFL